MAKKTTKTTDAAEKLVQAAPETGDGGAQTPVETAPEVEQTPAQAAPEREDAGFYCYIGPNLKGLIQTGTIYRGNKEEALSKAEAAVKAQPLVKTLIVSGDTLASARIKVKTPGNVLYASYQKLKGGK